jgi:hypothetical protein
MWQCFPGEYRARVDDHLKHFSVYREHHTTVAAALASAIKSEADVDAPTVEPAVEEADVDAPNVEPAVEAAAVSPGHVQPWQEKTAVTRSYRRVTSARPRLQHGSTDSDFDHDSRTHIRRSGTLAVSPRSLQQQLRRGTSAGATRVHSTRVESAPVFRGRAVVQPRTDAGYFGPHDAFAASAPKASADRGDGGAPGSSDPRGSAATSAEDMVPMSRLLPLFTSSVIAPTSAALPYTGRRSNDPPSQAACAAAAKAAAARHVRSDRQKLI